MRRALSTLGVVAALMVGACFDPTRPCNTDADCVNGNCDPGTKTCIAGGNPNDRTPPVFVLAVSAPPARQNTAKLTELDPGSPDGGVDAFRRDESVTVTVTSTDTDVDAGSVRLRVFGVSSTQAAPVEAQLVACTPGDLAASSPFCAKATVALASVPFDAFRGVMTLEASGSDLSNNRGTADAGVNVTRWRWRYSAGAPIFTTPAIADDGTVVFGTADGGGGSLYALTPEGSEKWVPVTAGQVKASPVIGGFDGGQQLAYAGTVTGSGGNLLAFDLRDGTNVASCPNGGGSYAGPFLGTPAIVTSGSASFEGVLAVASGSKLVNIRPAASGPDAPCITTDTPGTQAFASNLVAFGSDAYVATGEGLVRAFTLDSGNWVKNSNWGSGLGYAGVGDRAIESVTLTPSTVSGTTSLRGVFALDRNTGVLQANFPGAGISSDPGGLVLGGSEVVFGSGAAATPVLYSAVANLASGASQSLPEPLLATPVIGKGGLLYLALLSGTLEARAGSPNVLWSEKLGTGESFLASPTIGCPTEGGDSLGVLYAASTSGNLFSIAVDSAGLDPTAPWPKYQHDVRNTGNPTTPIQSCP